jgi:hypothetical protein
VAGGADRRPDGGRKDECEVAVPGVVETAQASSAVEGLNGQRPHCPGIGSPVETPAQAGEEAEMEGMRRKSGR